MDLFEEFKKAIRPLWGERPVDPARIPDDSNRRDSKRIHDEWVEAENGEEGVRRYQETAWTLS